MKPVSQLGSWSNIYEPLGISFVNPGSKFNVNYVPTIIDEKVRVFETDANVVEPVGRNESVNRYEPVQYQ